MFFIVSRGIQVDNERASVWLVQCTNRLRFIFWTIRSVLLTGSRDIEAAKLKLIYVLTAKPLNFGKVMWGNISSMK